METLLIVGGLLWLINRSQAGAAVPAPAPVSTTIAPAPNVSITPVDLGSIFSGGIGSMPSGNGDDVFSIKYIPPEAPPWEQTVPFECLSYPGMQSPYPYCNPGQISAEEYLSV